MKKYMLSAWIVTIAAAALVLFQVKHEVKQLERQVAAENSALVRTQEAIHVLEAEWSFLNNPARIAELAKRHLDLAPVSAEQVIEVEDLIPRALGENTALTDPNAVPPAQHSVPGVKPTLASSEAN